MTVPKCSATILGKKVIKNVQITRMNRTIRVFLYCFVCSLIGTKLRRHFITIVFTLRCDFVTQVSCCTLTTKALYPVFKIDFPHSRKVLNFELFICNSINHESIILRITFQSLRMTKTPVEVFNSFESSGTPMTWIHSHSNKFESWTKQQQMHTTQFRCPRSWK